MSKITLRDIAKFTGVSKSTVSRYFNGGYVSDEAQLKIKKIIKKYNYQPNTFARLNAKKSKMIGVVVPCLDAQSTARTLMGIDEHLKQTGFSTFILNSNHDVELEIQHLLTLERMGADGILLSATQLTDKHLKVFKAISTPLVVVGQSWYENCVIHDEESAATHLAEYVINKSYKNVLIISVEEWDESVGVRRFQTLSQKLTEKNVSIDTCISDFSYKNTLIKLQDIDLSKYDCIVCLTSAQLLSAYYMVKKSNLNCEVCGFGGYEYIQYALPDVYAIQFDYHELGKKSAEMVLSLIQKTPITKQVVPYIGE